MKSSPFAAALSGVTLTGVLALASGCAQPVMPVPAELPKPVDVYEVSGRGGLLILEPKIRFGPYVTVEIHRGMELGSSEKHDEGLLSSEKKSLFEQAFEFVLEGPGGSWKTRCVHSERVHSTSDVVGVHIDKHGVSPLVDERETRTSWYACDLTGPNGARWSLETDGERYRGQVHDEKGELVLQIRSRAASRPGKWDALEAYLFTDAKGASVAAVQRTYDGVVMLPAAFTPTYRAALAAVATALLIPGQ